ncbi:MAG: glycosyltransferase [Sulfurovum sp.]
MKKVILITSSFPYYSGEQFLETEINYHDGVDTIILPISSDEKIRTIPNKIKLDTFLVEKKHTIVKKVYYRLKSLGSDIFYKEFFSQVGVNLKRMKPFLSSMYGYQRSYNIFDNYFKDQKNLENTIVYTYWNTEATYALQSLKKKYGYKLVSRIHGGDLYQDRRANCYMPLKHLFTDNINKVFTITQSANEYLSKTYGFKDEILELSRLGVDDNFIKCNSSLENHFSIASCSFLVDLKRVDKIIDSIAILSEHYPSITFEWNHIGSGSLAVKLQQYAREKLSNTSNVKYKFLGHLDNQEVYEFYKNNAVDVFINVSEAEGVPVSIMEAMSCHIPIVAPKVGGISDMIINKKSGKLLSIKCEVDELVEALSDIEFFKNRETRAKSYEVYLEKYDAKKNYIEFIETLKRL